MRCGRCSFRGTQVTNENLPLRIWAMIGARAGDNDQVIALAEALGLPFEIKQLEYNALCHLGPRLLGRSTISLTPSSRASVLDRDLPDVTISAGHRSVPVVRSLRHRSGGRIRSIHVGFPRVSPGHFDLVIATPQYPIADHPKLLRVPYALTRAATASVDSASMLIVAALPRPRRLLVVGGPTLFWKIDERRLFEALNGVLEEAASEGGSVLVTISPRTPPRVKRQLARALETRKVPSMFAAPGKAPRYSALLEAAESIRITADSVAMISDAIWAHKPLGIVPVTKSTFGRMIIAISDQFRPGRRLYPQDLRYFWRALAEVGINERIGNPRISTDQLMQSVLDRIRPLLSRSIDGGNGGRGKD